MKKFFVYLSMISLLILPPSGLMAGNKKAEKEETKAVHVSTILMIATAYAAIDFATSCTDEWSAKIFAIGGAFFVYGEIKNWNKFKEASDRNARIYQTLDVEENKAQIQALQRAEDQTRDAASAARERASNAEKASKMFTAAAIVGLIEGLLDTFKAYTSYDDDCSGGEGSSSSFYKPMIAPFLNLVAPEAHAEADTNTPRALGLTSAVALASFATTRSGISEVMGTIKNSGYVRAGVFAGFAILANEVKSMTEEAADIYDKQADEYAKLKQKLISSLDKLSFEGYKEMLIKFEQIKLEEEKKKSKTNCAANKNGNDFQLDSKCTCRKTNSCKTVERPQIQFKKINVPEAVTSTLDNFTSMANASYSANDKEAKLAQNKIKTSAANLSRIRKELEDAANQSRIKNGSDPIDFDGNAKYFAALIKKKTRASISKEGMTQLADTFGFSVDGEEKVSKESKEEINDFRLKIRSISQPVNIAKKSSSNSKNPFEDLLFMAKLDNQEALDTAQELSKYKTSPEQDIHKKKSTSIFKIISNRYLKTAFPVFFEEK